MLDELNMLQGALRPLADASLPPKIPLSEAASPANSYCACSATTFEVLRTLYDRSNSHQIPFDTMLATNKDALARVAKVLTCTCSADPTLIMTLAASITKMMSWYQSVCRMPSVSSQQTPSSSASSALGTTHPTPIIVGVYRLDGEGENFVKMQVVLSELKKLDLLMERLRERFRNTQTEQENTFFGDLISFLRRKLREVVAGLQEDLKMDFGDVV